MNWFRCVTLVLLAVQVASAAPALELSLPLACRPGINCWVVRHLHHDPGPGFADYRCGALGADGHGGTDFAIADLRPETAVPVLASAAGTVRAARDGMPDQPPEGRIEHAYGARNCGNGVLIDHEGGWETQYCHLRRGSIRVAAGDRVAAGQVIGLVGMSGEANFPHVHLGVRHAGADIDPFTGEPASASCGARAAPLWSPEHAAALPYLEVPIARVGLTDHVPTHEAIVAGRAEPRGKLGPGSPALVAYLLAYGLRRGDRIELEIIAPDGSLLHRAEFDVAADAPRATRSAGRTATAGRWRSGVYRVEIRVRRHERVFARAAEIGLGQ